MHTEVLQYLAKIKDLKSQYFKNLRVLDVGGGDINGNNRHLFENCHYESNDLVKCSNITIISKTHKLPFKDNSFDTIISTECFEHDFSYSKSIKKIFRMLKINGLFVFTCASKGRPEHGTRRTSSWNSYGSSTKNFCDYYKNLSKRHIKKIFNNNMSCYFKEYKFEYNLTSHDMYFYGIKRNKEI